MWQKIKCWLGFGHKWKQRCVYSKDICPKAVFDFWYADCDDCKYKQIYCKHCGAIKNDSNRT